MFVTPLYAGLLTLWFVLLSVRVMNLRRRGIAFGDSGDVAVCSNHSRAGELRRVRSARPSVDGLSGGNSLLDLLIARARRDPRRCAPLPWTCAFVWLATSLRPRRRRSRNVDRGASRIGSVSIPRGQGPMDVVAVNRP
jgi:hypothetical protein